MKSNTDKLEALANSGVLILNRTILSRNKKTGREWYYAFLEELCQIAYEKEDILVCADYLKAAEKVAGL